VGDATSDAYGAVSPSGTGAPHADVVTGPLDEHTVDAPARLAHGVLPAYPEDARASHIEADVLLELVVSAQGTVQSARVVRAAGHGFDQPAIDAARRFRFVPAQKDGRAVPVRMAWTVQFRLW
jgi:TonB family protein